MSKEKEKKPPRKQRYNVNQIQQRIGPLRDDLLLEFGSECLESERFQYFVDFLTDKLPGDRIRRSVVEASVGEVLGEELTRPMVVAICWRLLGNLVVLRSRPVPSWSRQPYDEWVPAQIVSARYAKRRGRVGYVYAFRILAGLSASLTIDRFWTSKFAGFAARRVLGFTPSWGNYALRDARELVSTRLNLLIEQALCGSRPGFEQIDGTPSFISWNRKICASRRPESRECPFNYTHYCHVCPVGLDLCQAAVHPKTYVLQLCGGCDDQAYFDEDLSKDFCVDCLSVRVLQEDD